MKACNTPPPSESRCSTVARCLGRQHRRLALTPGPGICGDCREEKRTRPLLLSPTDAAAYCSAIETGRHDIRAPGPPPAPGQPSAAAIVHDNNNNNNRRARTEIPARVGHSTTPHPPVSEPDDFPAHAKRSSPPLGAVSCDDYSQRKTQNLSPSDVRNNNNI